MKLKIQFQSVLYSILLFSTLLGIPLAVSAAAIPLSDIATETVAIPTTGGAQSEYNWWSRYDIGFTQATGIFNVDLRIKLYGDDAGDQLRSIWEQGIEDIWSGQYQILQEDTYFYDVVFDVEFVDSYSDMHQLVNVHQGTGSTNMTNWYTQNPSGWSQDKQDEAAAHEAGHMFGAFDEYLAGAVNPDGSFNNVSDSLMGSQLTQTMFPRHYQFVADWAAGKQPGEVFIVGNSESPPLPGVPVPPAIYLFASGVLGLFGLARRKNRKY